MLAVCAGAHARHRRCSPSRDQRHPARRAPRQEPARRRAEGLQRRLEILVAAGLRRRRHRRRHRRRAGPRDRRLPRPRRHRPLAHRAVRRRASPARGSSSCRSPSRSRSPSPAPRCSPAGSPATPHAAATRRRHASACSPPARSARALAVGLAALIGSRGPVIAIVLAFHLVVEPQLPGADFLGDARQAIPTVAIARIGDRPRTSTRRCARHRDRGRRGLGRGRLAAGAWRTTTREI